MYGVNDEFDPSSISYEYKVDDVSIIKIQGVLAKGVGINDDGMIDVEIITDKLNTAMSDDSIKTIILDIDSPGGQVTGIEELGNLILEYGKIKPILAYTDTLCGSAAYWLASCCNGFAATPSSEIGSIGVFSLIEDHSERLEREGIRVNAFFGGIYKLLGMPFKKMSEIEKKWVDDGVQEQYSKFKSTVSNNRGGVKDEHMQGQIFGAAQALQANLIDIIVKDMNEFMDICSVSVPHI